MDPRVKPGDDERLKSGHDGVKGSGQLVLLEVFRQLQALRLVVRADALAVDLVGDLGELVVNQAPDDLSILQNERDVEAAHFEHGLGPRRLPRRIAEAGIEEAGIVHPILADQRIERPHLGDIGRGHRHALLRGEDVELVRVENEAAVAAEMHRLPELIGVVSPDRIDIDHAGIAAGAIADEALRRNRLEADAQIESFANRGLAFDQADIGMNLAQGPVADAPRLLAGIELLPDAAAETDLIEARAVARLDGESPRANLGEKRSRVALLDAVEPVLPVGDQPGENVEPPGRAFRIGETRDRRAELELLDERHEIDAARLQHRAVGQVDLMEFQLGELVADRGVGTGEEARPDAIGDFAEAKIEACRLDLIGFNLGRARDLATGDHGADRLTRQDAGAGKRASWAIARRGLRPVLGQRLEKPFTLAC